MEKEDRRMILNLMETMTNLLGSLAFQLQRIEKLEFNLHELERRWI